MAVSEHVISVRTGFAEPRMCDSRGEQCYRQAEWEVNGRGCLCWPHFLRFLFNYNFNEAVLKVTEPWLFDEEE